jgi:hypothetical protein
MSDSDVMADEAAEAGEDMAEMDEDEFDTLEVVAMHASMTAIGSVRAEEFDGTQCAIATAAVDGDASIGASVIAVLSANSVGVHQGGAAVMVVDGDVSIDQGAAQVVVARTVGIEQGGVGTLVAGEATLAHSWVGLMAARNATLSEDSRVVIDARSAIIVGAGLLGGLAAVACAIFLGGRRSEY